MRIGVVATASRIDPSVADKVKALATEVYPENTPDIFFHPSASGISGHFAGEDAARAQAFLDIANDDGFDALWFSRGGYGSCRLVEQVLPQLTEAARRKTYLGYSDTGVLLAGLYAKGFPHLAHGPVPHDILRDGGEAAVTRALRWLVERDPASLEAGLSREAPNVAFNLTVFSQLIGTPWQPDLSGHVLLVEEVSEYMYRIDRSLFHLTSNPNIRGIAGLRLGRCNLVPENDPDFGLNEDQVAAFWCERAGIPYLGRADIGHDADNKVVPFGRL
jgi:muramoyltetrapeptide carboxypeptidase